MKSFYYCDPNPSGFCFLLQIRAFFFSTSLGLPNVNVVVDFLFQVIFVFLLFWGMVINANEHETKENNNYLR